jgi:hypothetical protein
MSASLTQAIARGKRRRARLRRLAIKRRQATGGVATTRLGFGCYSTGSSRYEQQLREETAKSS